MESASVILDRNDKIFGQIYVENRETVPYDQLPPNLVNAVIAIEDNKFYQHHGYDLLGIVRAALKNFVAGHVRQGASTITQQLARNSFDLKGKTFRRKLLEMFVARRIEEQFLQAENHGALSEPDLFRRRTLRRGGGRARLLRQTGARHVPRGMRHPRRPGQEPEQTFALDRSRGLDAKRAILSSTGCAISVSSTPSNCEARRRRICVIGNRQNARGQNYAIDYIRQQVIAAVGWDRAMSDGFRIHTTIDAELQKVAEKSLRAQLDAAEETPGYESSNLRPIHRAAPGAHESKSPNEKSTAPPAGIFAGRGHRAR